jgi:polysaccharide biosynthesis transport protein
VSTDGEYVPTESVTVHDTFAVIGRRWRIIALLTLVGIVAALAYTHKQAIKYDSLAQVRVQQVVSDQFSQQNSNPANSVSMPTEQAIATSQIVAEAAAKQIGGGITPQKALSHLSVTVPASTQLLNFTYAGSSPAKAQAGAKAFANAYLANRKATMTTQIDAERSQLINEINQLQAKINPLQRALLQTSDPTTKQTLSTEISNYSQQLTQYTGQLAALKTVNAQGGGLTQPATLPASPSATSKKIVLVAGIFGGLVLGLIAAFMIDANDDHLHGPQDLINITGAPVLARVPVLRRLLPWRRRDLAAEGTSHPKVAEAYRLLANRLVVLAGQQPISTVLVVSPSQGEGRSSVAANLSATFVDLGCRVWLVSADLKPPQIHKLFSPDAANGVLTVVPMSDSAAMAPGSVNALTVGMDEASSESQHGHLTLMSTVERPRMSGRLLNPIVLARQVRTSKKLVDLTIIDAPALLEFADAVPLIPEVDGVIVVADAGTTRRSELVELTDLLKSTNAHVIGTVLNRDGSRIVMRRARRARRRISGDTRPTTKFRPGVGTTTVVPSGFADGSNGHDARSANLRAGSGEEPQTAVSGWPVENDPSSSTRAEGRGRARRRA